MPTRQNALTTQLSVCLGGVQADMVHKDMWKWAIKLAEKRDEILSKNPDMPNAIALQLAEKELMKDEQNNKTPVFFI